MKPKKFMGKYYWGESFIVVGLIDGLVCVLND